MNEKLQQTSKLDQFFQDNKIYIVPFFLIWGIAAFRVLSTPEKEELILFFAAHRTDFLNHFFVFCTHIGEGYVYAVATIAFLFIRYSKALAININVIFVLGVAGILKEFFQHERPVRYFNDLLHQPDLPNYVQGVALHDGWTTSFPSGHTISGFAFYTLLAFFIQNKYLKVFCLVLAMLVGISRMYLVQHFLKDVTSGMLTGFLVAVVVYWLHERFAERLPGKLTLGKKI